MASRTAIAKRELLAIEHTPGFAALPIELLHDILSHMQEPPIPHPGEWAVASVYRERRNALLALCQICRSLRVALLPLLWERLEACAEPALTAGRTEVLKRELIGQLHLVSERRKKYASYVRIVNVVIEWEQLDSMKDLANAMDLMPNLHTIQIICQGYPNRPCPSFSFWPVAVDNDRFLRTFESHGYPSVRRAILPIQARDMLASLPAVVDVYMASPYAPHFPKFATALAANCPVESLGWQMGTGVSTAVVEHLPNIRRVECHVTKWNYYVDEFKPLSALRNLEKLTLTVANRLRSTDDIVTEVIEAARKALAASPRPNKCVEVVFLNEDRTVTFNYH